MLFFVEKMTFNLHPQEMITESLDKCMLACVTRETLRIYLSMKHKLSDENKCAGKYTRAPSAKLELE